MSHRFADRIVRILTIPLYLIFILLGLIVMLFAGLLSLWQGLAKSNQELHETANQQQAWSIFLSTDKVLIEQQLAGSLPWDSGDYLFLKSKPTISYLSDKWFGDWFLLEFGGVFLQRWNDNRDISCDLVFINFETFEATILQEQLPTKNWETKKEGPNQIKFTFLTGDGDQTYIFVRPS